MIVFCPSCQIAYLVKGDAQETKALLDHQVEWASSFPCVTPMCSGRLYRLTPEKLEKGKESGVVQEVRHVPLHGFYRAINGFGSASGDPAPVALSKELLLTKRIVDVHAEEVGQPKRTILKRLILEDGTRLHFSRSTRGACLYYVERPELDVEVPDGSVGDDDARPDEVRAEEREEGRRDPEAAEDGQARSAAAGVEVPGPGVPPLQPAEGVLPDLGE